MDNELTYVNAEGHTVFTTKFLKNRGTCCKSACLHCPYGYTLKKIGMQFKDVTEADTNQIETIIQESGLTPVEWKPFLPDNIKFIEIKGTICGLILKNHIVVKNVFLKPHFQNQGLNKDIIESYYFI